MITVPGHMAIKTIHGRNGDFNVGRLETSIGEFVVKNAELDQYREGKYDGDFSIIRILPSIYNTGGRMVVEVRALLGGMVLSNIDALTKDEANRLSPQEIDPIDEEAKSTQLPAAHAATEDAPAPADALTDTTPFPFGAKSNSTPVSADTTDAADAADAALFGTLWPLVPRFKLDLTVDRRLIRQQRDRLYALGFEIDPPTQEWFSKAA